jgi:hypothetical protein
MQRTIFAIVIGGAEFDAQARELRANAGRPRSRKAQLWKPSGGCG